MSEIAVLPKYNIPGMENLTPDEAALYLHNKKNKAVRPEDDMEFPPYQFMPFPVAVYRDWSDVNKRREVVRIASQSGISMTDERQLQLVEDSIPEWETALIGVNDYDADRRIIPALREKNERDLENALSREWCKSPTELRAKKDSMNKAIAQAAAERAYDDRRLGELAKRELEAVEDASDEHVLDVPVPKRGPGRPRKETV